MGQDVVVVSNRGPLSFSLDESGDLTTTRGGGGLITAVAPAVAGSNALWIAGAITEADRRAAAQDLIEAEGFRLKLLDIEPDRYLAYYDEVANLTLWYLHHRLFDAVRRPTFDRAWRAAWSEFKAVNDTFATAVIEHAPRGAVVLIQDYHLSLLGPRLTAERPDLRTVHFNHTPFCGPDEIRMLPDDVAEELLTGLSSHNACGFHTRRWADAFAACCKEVLGSAPETFVSAASADIADLLDVAASGECRVASERLAAVVGQRKLIVRVDRIELSKNLLRGFLAFDELLALHPEWRGEVVFGAYVYPSRDTLADYLAYKSEVDNVVARINRDWGTADWTPIVLNTEDDFTSSVAALARYDVLLVNPVRDGLNLVAKEGPIVNLRDGALALSRESGAWDELGRWSFEVNPFDVGGTAAAIHAALRADPKDRAARATGLRAAITATDSRSWFADQIAAAG